MFQKMEYLLKCKIVNRKTFHKYFFSEFYNKYIVNRLFAHFLLFFMFDIKIYLSLDLI